MNRDEYYQLVKASEVFNNLDENLQKEILKAKATEKERYIQIFLTERNGIAAAQKELVEDTEEIVTTLERDIQKEKKNVLKSAEAKEKKSETAKAEALLDSM